MPTPQKKQKKNGIKFVCRHLNTMILLHNKFRYDSNHMGTLQAAVFGSPNKTWSRYHLEITNTCTSKETRLTCIAWDSVS